MKRLLPFVYGQFYSRLLWPVLAYLLKWVTHLLDSVPRVIASIYRLRLHEEKTAFRGQTSLAIGMLLAGWLGATLQAQAQSPGGVNSGLQLWLKANAGTSTTTDGAALTGWNDQSGNSRNHTQTTTAYQPKYKANGFNFNPAVTFDGLDAMVGNALASGKEAVHAFAMARVGDSGWRTIYGFGRDATHVQWLSTLPSVWLYGNYYANNSYGTNYGVTSYILPKDGSQKTIHWNGTSSNIAGTNTYVYNASKMGVGSDVTTDGLGLSENFLGDIAEVIIYKTGTPSTDGGRMDATDIQKVESYLGLKYGVTISHNYLSAAGATIYNVSSYSANVTGIGREDASGLNQKQSKSIDANALVTIGIGTGIAATNLTNPNSFTADNSFDIFGDNGAPTSFSANYAPTTFTPTVVGAFYRMSRTWKVQETGTVGAVTISVPASSHAERLLVSGDGTFTPGSTQEIALTEDGNGNMTATVNFNNGDYFTFGATLIAPGGVTAKLDLWLKADGITGVSNGANLNTWGDSFLSSYTVSASGYIPPKFYNSTASNLVNFNPAVSYNGSNNMRSNSRLYDKTSPWSVIGVGVDRKTYGGELRAIMGIGADGNYPAVDFQTDGYSPNGWNLWMTGSSPAEWTGGSGRVADIKGQATTQANIVGITSANGATALGAGNVDNIVSYLNGYKQNTTLDSYQLNEIGNWVWVGSSGGEYYNGLIPEVIIYEQQLGDTDMQKIQTYLAIKYGTTLGQSYTTTAGLNSTNYNYLATTGAVVWSTTANTGYNNNIFGIARDDAEGLNQKQSKSQQPGAVAVISTGTSIATSNGVNSASLAANLSYELIGDNGLPTSYSTVYIPTSFTPAGGVGFYRMARTWKVQETGTVGTITVGALASTFADHLLVSSDGTFNPANTQEIALTADGKGNLVAQIDLNNGQYFTFGAAEKAPGGVVAGLNMWLKAESITGDDGDQITSWPSSVLTNPYSVSQATASQKPTLGTSTTALVNFNQSLKFKRSEGQTMVNSSTALLSGNTPSFHFIAVGQDNDPTNLGSPYYGSASLRGILGNGLSGNNPAMDLQKDGVAPNGWNPWTNGTGEWFGGNATLYNSGGIGAATNTGLQALPSLTRMRNQQPQIYGVGFTWANSGTLTNVTQSSSFINSWVDGLKEATNLKIWNNEAINPYLSIGQSGGGEWWNGTINEVIQYTRELSAPEMQKVNTYLAIKYGVTIGQGGYTTSTTGLIGSNSNSYNYIATDGTTIVWNTTTNSGYNYDIAGIGFDNFEGLNQKQSRSVNATFQPAIGLGVVTSSNDANPGVFPTDKSYMIWGSNGQNDSYSVNYTPHSFTVSAPVYLMNRIWKVQETGTVGTVMVSIPGSATGVYLLVGDTPTSLSAGTATEYTLMSDGNGNLVATVDLADGQYFTFGKALFAPGCVTANLVTWYKADVGVTTSGSAVSNWTDLQSGYDVYQTTAANQPTLQPASVSFNYNPYLNFDGANDYLTYKLSRFISTTASGTMFGAASNRIDNGGYENLADLGIDNPHMGIQNNTQIQWLNGSAPAQINGNLTLLANQPQVYGYYFNSASTNGGAGTNRGLRLDGVDTYSATTASNLIGNGGPVDGMWTIGSYEGVENWNGGVGEIILYDRSLTTQEKDRIDTYLAVKYGATLRHNYLAGDGTTIYNVSSYSANVTGVGRDDCQQLYQKQSKSVSGGKMTISISNTVAASNLTNPGSFTTDKTFIVFGDNGATGTSALSAAATSCPPPPSSDKYTNLAYKVTETGNAGPAYLQEDVTGFGFNLNYPVYMQVFSDAGFTTLLASVPMSYTNGVGTALYDFPANATSYVRFAGNTAAPANLCIATKAQTFHWNNWWYGDKQKVLLPNYIPSSQSATAAMTMSVTVTDPNQSLLYRPTVDWWPVFDGYGLFIPRNDNTSTEGNIITTRMQFRQGTSTSVVAANTVSFKVWDIDGYIGGRDIVKIYGKQGSNIISPQLSRFTQWLPFDALQLNYGGSPQEAIGSNIPWDLGAWGDVYVNFDSPVEEVYVEYRKDNTYAFNVYNDMRIGPVTVTCAPPKPKEPLVDNVYVYKEVSPNPQKTDEEFTYKFTVQNTNCGNKTINLTDNLPGGLIWKDSTFVTSTSLTVGSVNTYGNTGNLQLSNVTVLPGTHYFYATAKGSVAGTYLNQASYVVTNGTGATYLSDDPSESGATAQPTPLTLVDNDPEANLTVEKSVNKATAGQNEVLTYTYTVTNPNATSAVLSTFQDVLPGELTYVGGTLTGIGSATASPYSGSAVLSIRGLNVAAGNSLTFTVQANANSFTIGAVANNVAQVTPDVNAGFRVKTYNSNAASTTITQPPTIAILSPANNSTVATSATLSGTATPNAQVVLTSSTSGTLCTTTATAGGTWSCPVTLAAGPQTLSAVASNAFGVSTPATAQVTATVASLTVNDPPAKNAIAGATNTGNAATELAPSGGTTPYSYTNDTGNASCSAVSGATALPAANLTVNSGTGNYSYTAPSTPGTYYFCIKVCDATNNCVTRTYTLLVSPVASTSATGTLDCSSAQILGIAAGTAGNGVLKLSLAVSTTGTLSLTVNGSGMVTSPSPYVTTASATGAQTFYVPLTYSGAAFAANTTITVSGFGTCTVDMTAVTPKTVSTSVLNLGPACTPATAATLIK